MRKLSLLAVLLPLMAAGCVHRYEDGQSFVCETRVMGLDASVPLPFAGGMNVVNIRFGWIENKIYAGNKVTMRSESLHKDISLLKGTGSIYRILEVDYPAEAVPENSIEP